MEKVKFGKRLKHAWNAFRNKTEDTRVSEVSYSYKPDRVRLRPSNERSIISAVYTKIAIDVAYGIDFKHVRLDKNERYKETVDSYLNDCLTVSANLDQSHRAFFMDVVISLLDEGCIAIAPIETTINPKLSGSYDITSMRVGKIVQWKPSQVKVRLYDERTGLYSEIWCDKSAVCIIENPFYAVMNEPNSTLKRLIRKLNILDAIDEQSGSGKLDLIIQLPYVIKTPDRKRQAEDRRKQIEDQLAGSKYGIAYTDGTEKITQLNRPAENNLMQQIEYLTSMLFSQLGMKEGVLDGTADEQTTLNYLNSTVKTISFAIVDEMTRKFLTKTARTQMQKIMFFSDPFKLVPITKLADIVDKFTRNEVASSNEMRAVIGWKPSDDPRADELRNKNLNDTNPTVTKKTTTQEGENTDGKN